MNRAHHWSDISGTKYVLILKQQENVSVGLSLLMVENFSTTALLLHLTTTSADEIHDGMNLELYYQ